MHKVIGYSIEFGHFAGGSDGKESACNAGDWGSVLGVERSSKTGMATHSSILSWSIPWTEEPGGSESMDLQSWRPLPLWKHILWASLVAQLINESACNAGDLGLIPGLGRSPGEGTAARSSILTGEIYDKCVFAIGLNHNFIHKLGYYMI